MFIFVKSETEWDQLGGAARQQGYERIRRWWAEHTAAGRLVGGAELRSTKTATTVRRRVDGKIAVTDGPFIESKESIGGYAVFDVPDLASAIELAKSWPPLQTLEALEIRPIVESRD